MLLSFSVVSAADIDDSSGGDDVEKNMTIDRMDVFANLNGSDSIRHVDLTEPVSYEEMTHHNLTTDGPIVVVEKTNLTSGSYSDLQKEIDQAREGSLLKLTQDYAGGGSITIKKSLTIDGQGHVLDGMGAHTICFITNGDVTLKNLVFKNGYYKGEQGGAIDIKGSTCVDVIGCTFTGNQAYRGGAISNWGKELLVMDSTFDGNTAFVDYGGAILSTSRLTVINSVFRNNYAEKCGGAIFNSGTPSGTALVEKSVFTKNSADEGGAIFSAGDLVLDGGNFEENTATSYGGAVCSDKWLSFTFSQGIFTKNHAHYGGAIYANFIENYATNLIFESNYAYSGGAVAIALAVPYEYVTHVYFKDCQFNNNYCEDSIFYDCSGGAILFYVSTYATQLSTLTIDGCRFVGNEGYDSAGAIFVNKAQSSLIFKGSTSHFEKNTARKNGGAVYCEGYVDMECEVVFESNEAGLDGGALYTYYIRNSYLRYGNFRENYANARGGALFIYKKCDVIIESCIFSKNRCRIEGGAVYVDTMSSSVSLFANVFEDNEAYEPSRPGHAVYNCGEYVSISNNWWGTDRFNFDDVLVEWKGALRDVRHYDTNPLKAMLIISSTNVGVNETVLIQFRFYPMYGGEFNGKMLDLANSVFSHDNSGEFSDLTYGENSVTLFYTPKDVGTHNINFKLYYAKTISMGGSIHVDGLSLSDNRSQIIWDDAYCLSDLQNLIDRTPENSVIYLERDYANFNRDYDLNDGDGVIVNKNIEIDGRGHTLSGSFLSRIFYSKDGTIKLNNIKFEQGKSSGDGGALYIVSDAKYIISNCDFTNNRAIEDGGAIYNNGKELKISDSTFKNNRGTGASKLNDCDGGAIHSKLSLTISNCIFTDNYAEDNGGAIYASGGLTLTGHNYFNTNTANKAKGGAIHTNKFMQDVSYAAFIGNRAGDKALISDDGGAIYIKSENWITFTSCLFANNHCTDEGGAIYLDSSSSHLTLINNIFMGNGAGDEGQVVFNCGYYDRVNSNYWSKHPDTDNDELIEWKAVPVPNVHHTDGNPLSMKLVVNDAYVKANDSCEVRVCFYNFKGTLCTGNFLTEYISFEVPSNVEIISQKAEKSSAVALLKSSDLGKYTVSAKLFSTSLSGQFEVIDLTITALAIADYYGARHTLNIHVNGSKEFIPHQKIIIKIADDEYVEYCDENGDASHEFYRLDYGPGTFEIKITLKNWVGESSLTVWRTIISQDEVRVYGNDTPFYATFIDASGNYLPEGTLVGYSHDYSPWYYTTIINNNGVAAINIENFGVGEHFINLYNTGTDEWVCYYVTVLSPYMYNSTVTVTAAESGNFSMDENIINVSDLTFNLEKTLVKLDLKNVNVKKSAYKITLKAILKIDNKLVKGVKLKFKFKNKTYYAKTNAKGIAKITVNKKVLSKLKLCEMLNYCVIYDKTTVKRIAMVTK